MKKSLRKNRSSAPAAGLFALRGTDLDCEQLLQFATDGSARLQIDAASMNRVRRGRETVEKILKSGRKVYGINTGFGRLAEFSIGRDQIDELQENLLISHAVGVGAVFSPVEVRAIWLLRVQGLLHGHSGVRVELVEALTAAINKGLIPEIPEQGSCGASGDLAPLAHLMLPVLGKGRARIRQGKKMSEPMSGAQALKRLKLKPVRLAAKEGLAVINGTQVMTALGALSCARLQNLLRCADLIGALSLEALMGSRAAFHPSIHRVRPHPGQKIVAQNLWKILEGSAILESHRDCDRVQDAYSLRCMPQVHGACRDALAHTRSVVEREMNSVTDNPLIFTENPEDFQVISGGNFHGQPVAQVLDFLAIGATDLASISERRIERLLNPDLSELPPFLAHSGGLHSGFMMLQVTAASLVSESKSKCFPASADSIPTSANKEDHVSMGTTSARKLREVVSNLEHVLAIELLCAAKAFEFRRPLQSTAGVEAVYAALRTRVKTLEQDREMQDDLAAARALIVSGELWRRLKKIAAFLD